MNQKFQNVLNSVPQTCPPIWMMRQAGRYHKHYQALRKQHGFMELCKKPKLAAEVALGPVEDFDFDVSTLFSDLLFPLEALGMGLEYSPAPKLGWHLTADNFNKLEKLETAVERLEFQKEAVIETRKVLPNTKSLIGFVGAPWTLFSYAVEGSHKGGLIQAKKNISLYSSFTELLMPLLVKNIQLQLDGGAELVMIFDTAAGELSPEIFKAILSKDLINLSKAFPNKLAYYSKNTNPSFFNDGFFEKACFLGQGIDHKQDLCSHLISPRKHFIQGNFDQHLLFQRPQDFEKSLLEKLKNLKDLSLKDKASWVWGLGHGVLPKTPEENVRRFVSLSREVLSES